MKYAIFTIIIYVVFLLVFLRTVCPKKCEFSMSDIMYILCTCNFIKKELEDESFSCNLLKFCKGSEELFLILKLSSIIFIKKYSQVSQDTFEVLFLKNINRAAIFRFQTYGVAQLCVHKISCLNLNDNATQRISYRRSATFFKKRLQYKCFPVIFEKFLRKPFWQNGSERLFLYTEQSVTFSGYLKKLTT